MQAAFGLDGGGQYGRGVTTSSATELEQLEVPSWPSRRSPSTGVDDDKTEHERLRK